jgi:hypothetical protein
MPSLVSSSALSVGRPFSSSLGIISASIFGSQISHADGEEYRQNDQNGCFQLQRDHRPLAVNP